MLNQTSMKRSLGQIIHPLTFPSIYTWSTCTTLMCKTGIFLTLQCFETCLCSENKKSMFLPKQQEPAGKEVMPPIKTSATWGFLVPKKSFPPFPSQLYPRTMWGPHIFKIPE